MSSVFEEEFKKEIFETYGAYPLEYGMNGMPRVIERYTDDYGHVCVWNVRDHLYAKYCVQLRIGFEEWEPKEYVEDLDPSPVNKYYIKIYNYLKSRKTE